jgi:trans-AT polyketide synthase/acyltransferase/oxidoreductase domain-containing protein
MSQIEKTYAPLTMASQARLLGAAGFRRRYHLRHAYMAGAMYKAIASKELVEKLARAQLLGSLGTGGCSLEQMEFDIDYLSKKLKGHHSFAANVICNLNNPDFEQKTVEILLRHEVSIVEASAFMHVTPALVYYRLSGIHINSEGDLIVPNRLIAKVSRPEVAQAFMSPAPENIVKDLLNLQLITLEQAQLSSKISMASDLCVEADSGGHTDQGVLTVLMPTIARLRDATQAAYHYADYIHVGAAGGIGTPEAVAAAFILGADFVVTGSINQCTVESGASDRVKSILQTLNIQDTTYAPAGDMFEIGAKVQVVRKGLLFAARANMLYQLYCHCKSLDDIDQITKQRIEEQYFKRSFDDIWNEVKKYLTNEENPKKKMALVFRWYFSHTSRLARAGIDQQTGDYQIHCGPALGAFNQWVKGSALENWQNRHVDEIAERLMLEAGSILCAVRKF